MDALTLAVIIEHEPDAMLETPLVTFHARCAPKLFQSQYYFYAAVTERMPPTRRFVCYGCGKTVVNTEVP
jgi:hypothetical protein